MTLVSRTSRTCNKCGVEQPIDRFHRHPRGKDGRRNICVTCNSAASRVLRAKDRSKANAANKNWYERSRGGPVVAQMRARARERAKDPTARATQRAHRKANRTAYSEYERRHKLGARYGITVEIFETMVAAQEGRCAVCRCVLDVRRNRNARNRATIDHDHLTGKVRGILCGPCNTAIGLLGDTLAGAEAAVAYLRRAQPT